MAFVLQLSFWAILFLFLYTILGYPLFLEVLVLLRPRPWEKDDDFQPTVTMIIAAHNEEKWIGSKLQNSLELDYPEGKLEIIVASDCSTDNTNAIVARYKNRVMLNALSEHKGKTVAHNETAPLAKGDILVFSDANTMYEPDAILELVRNFADGEVGYVCGQLTYLGVGDSAVSRGEAFYWKYELFQREREAALGSITAGNGAIYAMRRELFVPLPASFGPDFAMPLEMVKRGYRAVYEPMAIGYEKPSLTVQDEFTRRTRYTAGVWQWASHYREMYNPFNHEMFAWELLSHRFLRYTVPMQMILLFVLNVVMIHSSLFRTIFAFQLLFYMSALIGLVMRRWRIGSRWFYIPFYFCLMNLGSLNALLRVRQRVAAWTPAQTTRR